jgi:hypothetical protein
MKSMQACIKPEVCNKEISVLPSETGVLFQSSLCFDSLTTCEYFSSTVSRRLQGKDFIPKMHCI